MTTACMGVTTPWIVGGASPYLAHKRDLMTYTVATCIVERLIRGLPVVCFLPATLVSYSVMFPSKLALDYYTKKSFMRTADFRLIIN